MLLCIVILSYQTYYEKESLQNGGFFYYYFYFLLFLIFEIYTVTFLFFRI